MSLVTVLRGEVCRLAKKVVKLETSNTRKAVLQHRSEIARLKREIHLQARELEAVKSHLGQEHGAELDVEPQQRYTYKTVAKERKRLGVSASQMARLIGVSYQTIYSWEQGKTRPRQAQIEAILAVRKLGRREVKEKFSRKPVPKYGKKIVKFRKAS